MTKLRLANRLVLYELVGFIMAILLIWIDEIFDLPHFIFGAAATPINIVESIFESMLVIFLMILVVTATLNIIGRIKYLEGFLRVCERCKRVKTDEGWISLENYISRHSEADFSRGLCPDCAEEHYGIVSKEGMDL